MERLLSGNPKPLNNFHKKFKILKTILITGASSGIGYATALTLAKHNFNLILCGRNLKKLEELQAKIGNSSKTTILVFDVASFEEVEKAIMSLPNEFKSIDVLINNAGNAHGRASIDTGDIRDWDLMIDINTKGLLYVSKMIMPIMVEKQSGHIINIGSIAGKEVYPDGNIYCASKHAVDAITKAMRIDLLKHNIKVSGINPGLVETGFSEVRFKGDKEAAKKVYEGIEPLQAVDIAELIEFVITRPKHVNIADTVIFPLAQASSSIVNRKL